MEAKLILIARVSDIEVIGTFVEVLGFPFGCIDTTQPAVFGVPRSSPGGA